MKNYEKKEALMETTIPNTINDHKAERPQESLDTHSKTKQAQEFAKRELALRECVPSKDEMETMLPRSRAYGHRKEQEEAPWVEDPRYTLMTGLVTTFTILHYVRPDIASTYKTSVFLLPFSPTRIIVPFSIGYALWLLGIAFFQDFRNRGTPSMVRGMCQLPDDKVKIVHMIVVGFTSAFVLTTDIFTFLLSGLYTEVYKSLPPYEAGNFQVEFAWLATAFLGLLGLVGLCFSSFIFLWCPVVDMWYISSQINKLPITKAPKNSAPIINNVESSIHPAPTAGNTSTTLDKALPELPINTKASLNQTDIPTNPPLTLSDPEERTVIDSMGQSILQIKSHTDNFSKNVDELHIEYVNMPECKNWETWKDMYESLHKMTREMLSDEGKEEREAAERRGVGVGG